MKKTYVRIQTLNTVLGGYIDLMEGSKVLKTIVWTDSVHLNILKKQFDAIATVRNNRKDLK